MRVRRYVVYELTFNIGDVVVARRFSTIKSAKRHWFSIEDATHLELKRVECSEQPIWFNGHPRRKAPREHR